MHIILLQEDSMSGIYVSRKGGTYYQNVIQFSISIYYLIFKISRISIIISRLIQSDFPKDLLKNLSS